MNSEKNLLKKAEIKMKEEKTGSEKLSRAIAEIIKTGKELYSEGLVKGSTGNISARISREKFAITKTSANLGRLRKKDILVLNFKEKNKKKIKEASNELELHALLYEKRSDVNAIIHAHPVFANAFAVAGKTLPCILEEGKHIIESDIAVAEYAEAGSRELAENALKALVDKKAVLLKNHGIVCVGKSMEEALKTCIAAEYIAKVIIFSEILKK